MKLGHYVAGLTEQFERTVFSSFSSLFNSDADLVYDTWWMHFMKVKSTAKCQKVFVDK